MTDSKPGERAPLPNCTAAMESFGLGIAWLDEATGNIVEANTAFADMHGYAKGELNGRRALDLVMASSREMLKRELAKAQSLGQGSFDLIHLRKEGSAFPVTVDLSQSFPGEGGTLYRAMMVKDVSKKHEETKELKEALAAAKASEERLGKLVTAMTGLEEVIILMDEAGHIEYVNPAFKKLYGYAQSEVLGRHWAEFLGQGVDPLQKHRIRAKMAEFAVWRGTLEKRGRDGGQVEADVTLTPLVSHIGGREARGFVAVERDLTRERKIELTLRHAQKMEAIGTLAGGIAHDFNNILSAVLGFAELAAMDAPKGSDMEENVQEILTAGRRARDLVKQLLTFSRQTEGAPKTFVPRTILGEALKLLRASLPSTIAIEKKFTSGSAILGDPVEFHQVFMNLATNASLAMRGGGTLEVCLEDVDLTLNEGLETEGLSPGPYLKLTVADTGHGIPVEIQQRIFEPFYTTRPEGEGSGMGLAVVHGLVSRSGGAITLKSETGKGALFSVYWPRVPGGENAEAVERAALPTGTERVLFVDDEDFQLTLAKKMLGGLGYRVTAVGDPLEALELFSDAPDSFDLVVTDLTMPGLTGTELAEKILTVRPDIPVIVSTGYSELMTSGDALKKGIRAMVYKPVVVAEMAETIRRVLGQ